MRFAADGPLRHVLRAVLTDQKHVQPVGTFVLFSQESDHWLALGAVGVEADLAEQLTRIDLALDRTHDPHPSPPLGDATPLFGNRWWRTTPLRTDNAREAFGLAFVAFYDQPTWPAPLITQFHRLARDLRLVLSGADAERHERHETDQLALLMRYAANPIILSDGSTIINMNEPATRLFDISPAHDPTAQHEQVGSVAGNLKQLRTFLAEANASANDVQSGELQLEDPHTQEEVIMAIVASHVAEALGGLTGTVSVLHDMTRARELEQHRIREQLFESEKLAATGRLAASIAHEINNPLEAIKNSLYLLVRQIAPDDPNRQFLELARRETERVSRIIRQMLGVSRPSVTFAPTQVNEIIQDALQLLGPQLRQGNLVLTVQLDEKLPLVRASADQLKQVFLNLLLNAREATPNGGGILVQTRIAHEGDAEFLAGKHVIVRIRDDGSGIPSEVLPHVFEPFFSTKTERHGTGLGLWVCQDIIKHHGGHIIARSMVGRGSTFLVALPFIAAGSIL